MRELLNKILPRGSFARSVSVLAGGTALSQMIAVLVAPILTRLYPVEDFGCFQLYMSVMAFGILAITLRYEQAILLPERDEVAADLFVLVFFIVGVLAVGLWALEWFVNRYGLLPGSMERLRPYLWIVALGICAAGIYQALNFWALRLKAYSRVSGTKITQVFVQLTTQTAIGLLHIGPLGLLLGDAIGRISGSLSLAKVSWRQSWGLFRKVRCRTMWAAGVRYRHFPFFSSWAALLGAATAALAPLCLAQFYGIKTLGWYALGDRVLGAPTILIGQAVSQVYSVEAAAMNLSDPITLRDLFIRSVKKLMLLGIIPFIIFVAFSPSLFGFVFGQSWREAGVYARLLAGTQYIAFIVWPLMPTLNILERQSWQLAWDASRVVLALGSLFIAHNLGYTARGAVGTFSLALGVGYVAYLVLSYRAISKRVLQFRQNQDSVSHEYAELVHP